MKGGQMFRDKTNQQLMDEGCDLLERYVNLDPQADGAIARAYLEVALFRAIQELIGLLQAERVVVDKADERQDDLVDHIRRVMPRIETAMIETYRG